MVRTTGGEPREVTFSTGVALLLPITLSTMAIVLLAPILPQLMEEFGDQPNADYLVPMILTVPALCVAILSPVAGMLGDYFGRRRLLIASLLVYGVFGVAPMFLSDLRAILLTRVGVGVTEALLMTLSTTMIGDYFAGARRDKWLAAQTAFASLSALLFFNVGGMLGTIGWRAPFGVYLTSLLMLALVLRYTWPTEKVKLADGGEHHLHNLSWKGFPWLRMLGIVMVTIYGSVLFYTVQIQASPGLALLGLDNPAQIGFLTSIASVGVPVGTFIYSRFSRRPVQQLLLAQFILLGAGFTIMGAADSIPLFLTGCALNQIGAGMLLPTLLVWAISQLEFEVRARGAGIWTSAFSLGQWLSPIIVTLIGARWGGLQGAFSALAMAALLATAFAFAAELARRRAIPAQETAA